ncbi:O-methyltransferase asqN [Colletotrichum spinosum]|uniref:O-methyltransferase asqN n=1 Tax=Colletotrichum spinosum TaxID=1347390 RepID=A0A4R8PVF1_9PEZI|nr:O-methyltransferase asqN [Colletotrichum spinosum]
MLTQSALVNPIAPKPFSLSRRGDGFAPSQYEKLGAELVQCMAAYSKSLEKEGLPEPSLSPGLAPKTALKSGKGLQDKARIVELARQILATTLDPSTSLFLSSLQFHFCACLKVVLDLKVGDNIPQHGRVSRRELADALCVEEGLLARVMRVVMTNHVFDEPEPGYYSHTSISWAMQGPAMHHLMQHRLGEGFRAASREPDALRRCGYRNPAPGDPCGFNLAFGYDDGTYWDYIAGVDRERGRNFNQAMKAVTVNSLAEIPRLYPWEDLLDEDQGGGGGGGGGGLIVDVGGGLGQVSRKILEAFPNAGLRCVVQDKHAVARDDDDTGAACLKLQQHDFFQPQPIQGAAVYHLRHILHDWPDDACVEILRQIVPAMDPARSRILICDQIVQDHAPSHASVLYDVDMMSLFNGKERTLPEFAHIFERADPRLYVKDVRRSQESATTMIELRLSA